MTHRKPWSKTVLLTIVLVLLLAIASPAMAAISYYKANGFDAGVTYASITRTWLGNGLNNASGTGVNVSLTMKHGSTFHTYGGVYVGPGVSYGLMHIESGASSSSPFNGFNSCTPQHTRSVGGCYGIY